ncbi:translation initiation factor IF-2-like [Chiloscyllium plagiosum]|uniref:translation initiation factor IF-2-like n=1 Tax=Chiloscyllium plagiosum TaxID=36176 RepID=UPI001CB814D9|nr:translation initiation factor IF-2-like [Chiloscyllium plagiosum]
MEPAGKGQEEQPHSPEGQKARPLPPPRPFPSSRIKTPSYPAGCRWSSGGSRPLPSPGSPASVSHHILTVSDPAISPSRRSVVPRRHSLIAHHVVQRGMVTSPPRPARTPAPLVRSKDGAPSLPHRDAAERKTEGACARPRAAPTLPGAEQRNGLEREPRGEPREVPGSRRALPGDAGGQQHGSPLGPKILETLGQFGVRRVEAPGQRREEEEEEEKGALELPCPPLSAAELLAPGSMFEGAGSEDAPSLLGDGEHPFDAIDLDIVSVLSSPNLLACGAQGDCPAPAPAGQGEIPQPGAAVPERRGRQRGGGGGGGGASEGEEEDEEDEDDDLDNYYNFARTVVTEEVMEQLASECFGLDSAEVPTIDQLDGVDDSDGGGGEGGGAEEGRAPPSPPQPHQAPLPPPLISPAGRRRGAAQQRRAARGHPEGGGGRARGLPPAPAPAGRVRDGAAGLPGPGLPAPAPSPAAARPQPGAGTPRDPTPSPTASSGHPPGARAPERAGGTHPPAGLPLGFPGPRPHQAPSPRTPGGSLLRPCARQETENLPHLDRSAGRGTQGAGGSAPGPASGLLRKRSGKDKNPNY